MAALAATRPAGSRRNAFLRGRWSNPVLGAVGVIAIIAIWELASRTGLVDPSYLPPFSSVITEVFDLLAGQRSGEFWTALGMTMYGWSVGLVISLALGIVVGVLIGSNRWVREYTNSTIEFLRPIPSVGLIPIAIVVYGVRPAATIAVVVWACFWVILIHVIAGVADVDPVADATARSYGLKSFRRAAHVVWPTVLPYLMTGLRLCGTIALVVAITIEIVVQTPGIGAMIATYQSAANVTVVYALALLTGVLGLAINLLMRLLENSVLDWHPSVRAEVEK